MPYSINADLPESVRGHIPDHARDMYREDYNNAWEQYTDPESQRDLRTRKETSHAVAWSAVDKVYRKSKAGSG